MSPSVAEATPWFSTKGQILQTALAFIACVFAAIKAWPDMRDSQFVSLGAMLFYALVGSVLAGLLVFVGELRRHRGRGLAGGAASPEASASAGSTTTQVSAAVDAPDLLIAYRRGRLVLTNERGRPTIVRRVGQLLSRQEFVTSYPLNLVPSTFPPLRQEQEIECDLTVMDPYTRNTTTLEAVLSDGPPEASDSITVDYDDSAGRLFSRCFSLTRNQDGTVACTPELPAPRGSAVPVPGKPMDMAQLRFNLGLAASFPAEHAASEQYARELADCQSRYADVFGKYGQEQTQREVLEQRVKTLNESVEALSNQVGRFSAAFNAEQSMRGTATLYLAFSRDAEALRPFLDQVIAVAGAAQEKERAATFQLLWQRHLDSLSRELPNCPRTNFGVFGYSDLLPLGHLKIELANHVAVLRSEAEKIITLLNTTQSK